MALTNIEKLAQVRDCAVKVNRKISLDNYLTCHEVLLDLEWMVENLDSVINACLEKEKPPELKKVDG